MSTNLNDALSGSAGKGQSSQGQSVNAFLASLAAGISVFGVEALLFLLIKNKLVRIYQPRTYLVPGKERTAPPPKSRWKWVAPVFHTSNAEFIQKCGLDAYFFLRFLRMLLKIFIPLAFIILPILLPLNAVGGRGSDFVSKTTATSSSNVTGLDTLAWGNVRPDRTNRYWAHLVLAVFVVVYVCFTFYDELRGYVRLRQAYLTSPQHRLRASATTVLVTAIPRKWLSLKALDGLYDVFPGGIRNIWINRDYSALSDKVDRRDKLARALESAETDLIKKADAVRRKREQGESKKEGTRLSKSEKARLDATAADDVEGGKGTEELGSSAGNPHQVRHHTAEIFSPPDSGTTEPGTTEPERRRPVPILGAATQNVGRGLERVTGSVVVGLKKVGRDVDERLTSDGGFVLAEDEGDPPQKPLPATPTARPTVGGASDGPGFQPAGRNARHVPDAPNKGERGGQSSVDSRRDCVVETAILDEDEDKSGKPAWELYLKPSDRDTMRLPLFGLSWLPSIPLLGKKVDTIKYCRREVARLNAEIERDQQDPEGYPLMNSAFVQFNHQVAAHMACQAVSHHVPKHMAPRLVEISPDDVVWDNMSIRWWERYLRAALVTVVVGALIVGWAFPVTFTGLLSQLSYLSGLAPWLNWIGRLPTWLTSLVQGILPQLLLGILMALLPIILRFLAKQQGVQTGMGIELLVQQYYFAFSFIQIFLVVSISSGITSVITELTNDVTSAPSLLAQNLPKASNYFFSYMLLQALSVSAGALVQITSLITWFVLAPLLDSTARQKWKRQTSLPQVTWGTFFPVYTNLAAIGLIYSVISPLILIFNILTFGLFWFVYRYNTLYVTRFRFDTGGLLFPTAINQLFTGLYFMEICLIGLFFLVRNEAGQVACTGQAIIMIVVFFATALFQYLLNDAFSPLFRYLPITLEDDAVERDEAFALQQRRRHNPEEGEEDGVGIEDQLEEQEQHERDEEHTAEQIELQNIEARKQQKRSPQQLLNPIRGSWATRSRNKRQSAESEKHPLRPQNARTTAQEQVRPRQNDLEAQRSHPIGDALFNGINDEIEDLTPDERDKLIQRAFLHEALRAKRPVVWIPRDKMGISDDEIARTQLVSKHVWISNEYTGLDHKGRVVYRRSPPDFSEIDVIDL
ncbi:MAG: hypothetical protein M1838_004615 [Thelocarpon superellum]|nr:MAG: hypothetical protein M1838_004615 [Thelocarpon superellum]